MSDIISLTCPSCGNKLQITEDVNRFACAACGNEHMVNRSGNIVMLNPVLESIQGVQVGIDKAASELAIQRLQKEIDGLQQSIIVILKREKNIGETSKVRVLTSSFMYFILIIGLIMTIFPINSTEFGEPKQYFEMRFIGILGIVTAISIYVIDKKVLQQKRYAQRKKDEEKMKYLKEKLEAKKIELARHEGSVSR